MIKTSTCKYCGNEIVWQKDQNGRNVPVNAADGSKHDCRQGSQYGGPAPAPTQGQMAYQHKQWVDGGGPKPVNSYPSGAEKREGADIDRQTIIVWQNMMSHAVEIRKMCGDFPDHATPEDMAYLTKEVVIIAWNLMEEARKVWNNGVPVSVTESAKVSG